MSGVREARSLRCVRQSLLTKSFPTWHARRTPVLCEMSIDMKRLVCTCMYAHVRSIRPGALSGPGFPRLHQDAAVTSLEAGNQVLDRASCPPVVVPNTRRCVSVPSVCKEESNQQGSGSMRARSCLRTRGCDFKTQTNKASKVKVLKPSTTRSNHVSLGLQGPRRRTQDWGGVSMQLR